MKRVLVTGGAGFLGSHFIRHWLGSGKGPVLNVDALTYAGNETRLADARSHADYSFAQADVRDREEIAARLAGFRPDVVVHFAAESHVTRSEDAAEHFWSTNVDGTTTMLEAAAERGVSRFVHISTDEVYGPITEGAFQEDQKETGEGRATSPYARSKAVADDVARSFTERLPVVVLRPTNCFGPWQFPEKAFARWVTRALSGRPIPVWGDGLYVRQWLHAQDLARAIEMVVESEAPDPVYNVGPKHTPEVTNLDLARWLTTYLGLPGERVVLTAYDRPDHDRRYAVDPGGIEALGWRPGELWKGLAATVDWYRESEAWWRPLLAEAESIYSDEQARA